MAATKNHVILRCTVDLLWVPRHPIVDGMTGETVRWRSGKIRMGQQFVWHGKPGHYPVGTEVVSGGEAKVVKAPPVVPAKETAPAAKS